MNFRIRDYYKRLKGSKEGKVLAENFAYLTLLQIIGYIFPLITMPYLARVIGVEGFGKIAFAAAIIVWVQTVADWGFNYTATRDIARCRNDKEKVSEIFSNVLGARFLLMFISLVILLLLVVAIPSFRQEYDIILLTFLMVPGHILFPDWFFQAIERMRFITILNFISRLVFTLLIFVFIKKPGDYLLQPILQSVGYIVSGFISLYLIIKWGYKIKFPVVNRMFLLIKSSTDVFINNIVQNLYYSFSIMLLGVYSGANSTGLLDAGNKFVNVAQQFLQVVSRTFFPFLSRRIDKHSFYAKATTVSAIVVSGLLFIGAPWLISIFFTEEFSDACIVLRMLSVSIVFLTLSNVYGTNYLILQGKEKELRQITTVISLFCFAISFPLIKYYSFIGTALVILIARVLLGISIYLKSMSIKRRIEKQ